MKAFRHALLIITIILLLLAAGCGKKAADDTTTTSTEKVSAKDLKQFDEDVQELLTRNDNYVEPKPTSFAKISDALDAGDITKEEWVMLTILAAYAPDQVPDKYKGVMPRTGRTNLQEAKWWMSNHWDEFSESTQDILEPFYVMPDDPKSFHNPDNTDKKAATLKKLEIIPSVEAANVDFLDVIISTSPSKSVLITYPKNNALNKKQAGWANESIRKAWPMFENLLGKYPTQKIYLLILNTGSDYGTADYKNVGGAKRCIIEVNNTLDEKKTKTTVSHELFHCFQYYIPLEYDQNARMWMMEATATWSEHWVWPSYNTEWEYLAGFFKELHKDLIVWNEENEYSSYMWYLYYTQMTGNLGHVKDDLFAVKNKDGRVVVADDSSFKTFFPDFALWNWNQDPEQRYQDAPKFPDGPAAKPNGPAYKSKLHSKDTIEDGIVTAKSLTNHYRVHVFKDDIEKVLFRFDAKGDEYHRRQALIKIGDIWHWEDWTEIEERKFCRSRDDEKVVTVVLIVTNAKKDKTDEFYVGYEVDTNGKCNPEWRGTTSWTWSHGWGWQILHAAHSLEDSGMMVSHDTLVYDEEEDEFYIKDMVISYRYMDNHMISFAMDECGMMYENIMKQWSGSAQSSWDIPDDHPSEGDAPTRAYVDYDDPLKYHINIDITPDRENWIHYIGYRSSARKACPLEGISTPSAGSYHKSDTDFDSTSSFPQKPYDIEVQISDDGKRLKGSESQEMGSGDEKWYAQISVDYQYG